MSKRNSMTAESQPHDFTREKKKAEYRLRMVEKIAQYREQKIKKEFERIEKDLFQQEQEQQQVMLRE